MITQRRKGGKDAKEAVDGKGEGRNFTLGLLCVFALFASLRELLIATV